MTTEDDTSGLARDDSTTRLDELLGILPVGIVFFDRLGRVLGHWGAHRDLFGESIPSRDPAVSHQWQFFDGDGQPVDHSDSLGARVLRGEEVSSLMSAVFETASGQRRRFHVLGAPHSQGGIAVVYDAAMLKPGMHSVSRDRAIAETGAPGRDPSEEPGPQLLTEREVEVLKGIARGMSHKEIASHLSISVKTVDFHRRGAAAKLSLRNRTDIVRFAANRRWFDEEF